MPERPLVIVDRDGVINVDSADYIKSAAEWLPIESSLAAIGELTRAGYPVAVVSNQSGIGRGLFDVGALDAIHAKMTAAVAAQGGNIGRIYYCPHLPDAGCDCRKPAPGLLLKAASDYGVSPRDTVFIGDKRSDIEAAWAIGARAILVESGLRPVTLTAEERDRVEVFPNLLYAVRHLLQAEA